MEKYKKLHLWMIVPMILMQLGIYLDYWGDFTDNAWSVHVHYWTGSIWYVYLIIQPYYASHGQINKHRTNGIIGMMLAGAVAFTAISMMYRDLENAHRAAEFPERFAPFKSWFFYGVAVVEIVMMPTFIYAVIKSIIHRKETDEHAWWLIVTVFYIMMPALGRGIQLVWLLAFEGFDESADIMPPVYFTQFLIIIMLLIAARKYKKIWHSATYIGFAVNIFCCFLEQLGKSQFLQNILETFIKG